MRNLRFTDIDRRLHKATGIDLRGWLLSQRASNPPASFGLMASRLAHITGDFVSHETLRRWTREAESTTPEGDAA